MPITHVPKIRGWTLKEPNSSLREHNLDRLAASRLAKLMHFSFSSWSALNSMKLLTILMVALVEYRLPNATLHRRKLSYRKQQGYMILSPRIHWVWILLLCLSLCALAQEPALTRGQPSSQNSSTLILAHYMPWYTSKPFSDHWGWHWTMNKFDPEQESDGCRQIASRYHPIIGPYDSGDPYVLEYHLLLMKLSGIDGVIVDWYGLTDYRDYAILNRNTTRVLEQCERLKMKFVICYEDQTIPALVEANRIAATDRVTHAVSEIAWLGKYWFKSGSYVQLDNRPVLLSFGHSGLTPTEWSECLSRLDSPVAYFSQDIRRDGAVGGFGWPAPNVGMPRVDQFLTDAAHWPASIPAAFPRFNDIYRDAGVGDGYPQLPDDSGRTFQTTLQKAIKSKTSIIQIATWNDWGEGTQIEPSIEFGYRDLEHLQSINVRKEGRFTTADLHLPIRILKLRQTHASVDTQKALDEIALLIVNGDMETARRKLDQLPVSIAP